MRENLEHRDIVQHNEEIQKNLEHWNSKPVLRKIYLEFHELIAKNLAGNTTGLTVEIGSGIGNIKEVVPGCIRTDLFPNPWIDRVENAYSLSFPNVSVSNLILFDVFHHLRYPGTALKELHRVLLPHGRVVIFEPCLSVVGLLVFGFFHHEKLGLNDTIQWFAPSDWSPNNVDYYAAQANATRIFIRGEFRKELHEWRVVKARRLSAVSYVASGGYSRRQLYPDAAFPIMRVVDRVCDRLPSLFATRLLLVLEKRDSVPPQY